MIKSHSVYYPLYNNKDKFIILITGGRGCEHPDTPILMADLSVKKIKDIGVGDYVMGDDGTPRCVLKLFRGESDMYRVKQSNAEDYIVNSSHILVLRKGDEAKKKHLYEELPDIMEMPISMYMQKDSDFKKNYFGYKVDKAKGYILSRLEIEPLGEGKYCGLMLNGNHRYLHPDGTVTHNSGKSFSTGTFIERLTFEYNEAQQIAHKILYTRYTMVSAAISVIPEVKEKIEADGTQDYFKSTKTDIINRMTGGEIMFRGINTSSGNQTAKLKSIHGVTTFVVDEAEEFTSYDDFERIMLSIRQKGLQNRVIIIMNPSDSTHWVYRKYIENTHTIKYFDGVPVQISTHPNVLHIHTTYLDNIEHLSAQFLKEVLDMKANDPDRYAHIVMGRWSDVSEGAVFKHIGIVDKFPENAKKVALGVDWGYAKDVTAVVKCGIVGNRLYLDEVCYKTGLLSSEIIKILRPYTEEGIFSYADSADPRLIDEVALGGVIIYAVQKGAGSIVAGIDKMQTFEIFVTRRSIHLQEEGRKYVWAKDKDGNYINVPEDHDNHLWDAARYYTNGVLLGKVMKPRNVRKSDLGVY